MPELLLSHECETLTDRLGDKIDERLLQEAVHVQVFSRVTSGRE